MRTKPGLPGSGVAVADEMLAARARRGDLASLATLLDRWSAMLTRFCRRRVGHDEDARDLAQETLLKAIRALDRYDPARPFAPWIYRIARNTCFHHLERRHVRRSPPPGRDRAEPPPDVIVARREEVRRVRRAMRTLGPDDRRLLSMKLLRGLDNTEIASRLSIGRGALRTRTCRALSRLRAALAAVAAALLLLIIGPSLLRTQDERLPVRPADEPPGPEIAWVEPLASNDLGARISELEARGVRPEAAERSLPKDPEEAIAAYDWDALAEALLGVNPELLAGRDPTDPGALARYLESLRELVRLAEAAGLPDDLAAIARDPRTGPKLFGAMIRRAWPDVADADVAAAEEAARRAMTEYAAATAEVKTPAQESAAESRLAEDLAREVEEIEERYGEPEVEVESVVPVRVAATADVVTKDAALAAVLTATPEDRVVSGTADTAAKIVATQLAGELSVDAASLSAVTSQWVVDYTAVLDREAPDVVEALEADLRGEDASGDVAASSLHRLRAELLDAQADAEDRMLRALDAEAQEQLRDGSRPTFFLLSAPAASVQSLGNSIR